MAGLGRVRLRGEAASPTRLAPMDVSLLTCPSRRFMLARRIVEIAGVKTRLKRSGEPRRHTCLPSSLWLSASRSRSACRPPRHS